MTKISFPKHPDYCYHTHTSRCGHAYGKDEEYVLEALKDGYRVLGFADHAMFPHFSQPGMRGDYRLLDDYLESINGLRKKYAEQIKIYSGFECEYSRRFLGYLTELLSSAKLDYLILGQHLHIDKERYFWYPYLDDLEEALDLYAKDCLEALDSGLFAYFAHPDHFMSWYPRWNHHAEEVSRALIEASIQHHVYLEINMGRTRIHGYYEGQDVSDAEYPAYQFWQLAASYGVKSVIGVDAHMPKDLTLSPFSYINSLVEKTGVALEDSEKILKNLLLPGKRLQKSFQED